MGLLDRIKYGTQAQKRAANTLGLRLATPNEVFGDNLDIVEAVPRLALEGNIAAIEQAYTGAWLSKVRNPSGTRLYDSIATRALLGIPDDPERALAAIEPFRAYFVSAPSGFSAALYSGALTRVAWVFRGQHYANETPREAMEMFQQLTGQAAELLSDTQSIAGTTHAWHAELHSVALHGDREFLDAAFERVWALDPANLAVIQARMSSLLPRWQGRDVQECEEFARRAVEETESEWGAGAYAYAYNTYLNLGDSECDDYPVDRGLLKRGYLDLLERDPNNVMLLNDYAAMMSWSGQEAEVVAVFEAGLRAIEPDVWHPYADREEDAVLEAARLYLIAKDFS